MASTKQKPRANPLSAERVNVWDLLRAEMAVPRERPANSVTIEEFSERTGYGPTQASRILKRNPQLKAVVFVQDGKRRIAYVPA